MEYLAVTPARDPLSQCLTSYPVAVSWEISAMQRFSSGRDVGKCQQVVVSMMIVYRDLREDAGRGNAQYEDNNRTEVL